MSAEALGWGRGWPNCVTGEIVTAVVGANRLRLPVRHQIVALVAGLVADIERSRAAHRPDWSWGFACRAIRGTTSPSNHSQGVAVDLDAPENPHLSGTAHAQPHSLRKSITLRDGRTRLMRTTMPPDVDHIAHRWGFRWGGQFNSPDPMHFEIRLTPTQVARLIADLRGLDGRPVTAPLPAPSPDPQEAPVIFQQDYGAADQRWRLVFVPDGTVFALPAGFSTSPATMVNKARWDALVARYDKAGTLVRLG